MEPLQTIEQAEEFIGHFRQTFEQKRGIRWAILLKDDQCYVGLIWWNHLALGMKRAEVGFEIHPNF